MKSFPLILLAFLALACITLPSCSPYDDGPALSLRSKSARMAFTRPLTRYFSNGIDSTAEINQIFADSLQGFTGPFIFWFEPNAEYNYINWGGDQYAPGYGVWLNADFERIAIDIPNATWSGIWYWRITRLSNKQLWLEYDGGYELRFEE